MSRTHSDPRTRWLGKLPAAWAAIEPRRIFKLRRQPERPGDIHLTPSQAFGVLPQDEYVRRTGTQVVRNLSGTTMQHVEPGDFISHLRTFQGGLEIAQQPGKVSPAYTVVTPTPATYPRYYRYVLKSEGYISQIASVTDQLRDGQSMRFAEFNQTWLPLPSLKTQKAIADYLDRETAEIDAFISDQQRLLTLARERLEAEVALRTTGADIAIQATRSPTPWMPDVLTPYDVVNIRRVAAMRTGHTPSRSTTEYWSGERNIPWFTLADVWRLRAGQKFLGETADNITSLGLANSAADLLPKGTVVLSRTASVGFTGIMPHPMATSQDFWNWVCTDDLDPEFLWYQFRAMRPEFDRIKSGSTHKTIYQADAAALRIVLPPIEEQRRIVSTLNERDKITSAIVDDAARAITLAKERRAALITAAVTGQIDVTAKNRPAAEQLEDDTKELS